MSTQRPVLLLDVMSTLVTEPFLELVPRFFGVSLEELLAVKDRQSWIDFEHGRISEEEYARRFFTDGRTIDVEGLKAAMYEGYEWMPGTKDLLRELQERGFEMHALSNYSSWYQLIERKLRLSEFLTWRFVSCETGLRKPDPESYLSAARSLGVPPEDCLFVDDRPNNVAAAEAVGMPGILRSPDIGPLREALRDKGLPVRP